LFHISSKLFNGEQFSELSVEWATVTDESSGERGITDKSFFFIVDFTGTFSPSGSFTRE
jgi:hypothetical protein